MRRAGAWLVVVSAVAAAQAPRVGEINFYGLGKVTPEKILGAIDLKAGDLLPSSKGELEDRISEIPGVVLARVEAVCCEGPSAALFIGIEEKGAPHAGFRSDPSGDATLPQDLVDSYHAFLGAVERAAGKGDTAEDLTAGHSLMANPEARAFQERFATFAATRVELLRDIVRNAAEAEERAIAAAVIGYAPSKQDVVNDLQYALQDPDRSVRANAARSLAAIAVLWQKQPDPGMRISPTWFIEMLNSVELSDRVESTKALLILTDGGNGQTVLDRIRERAFPAVVEMARWQTLRYALPPFLLVGRLAGLADAEMQRDWQAGDRETIIRKALAPTGKKRGR